MSLNLLCIDWLCVANKMCRYAKCNHLANKICRVWKLQSFCQYGTIASRVKGLEMDHVHTFALYIEPRAVNIVPFNTS